MVQNELSSKKGGKSPGEWVKIENNELMLIEQNHQKMDLKNLIWEIKKSPAN